MESLLNSEKEVNILKSNEERLSKLTLENTTDKNNNDNDNNNRKDGNIYCI